MFTTGTTTKPGSLKLLRLAITLQTLSVFATPVTAGLLLTTPSGHVLHSGSSYTLFFVTLFHLIAAILAWRPGGGSATPVAAAAGFFALTLAQVFIGIAHLTTVHVPLGVLLFGLSVLQLAWVWNLRRADRIREGKPA
ncbi:hypothetical protein [Stackebrandtia nassauensis]|uniref:Uncharacterized protein n=1 Tax=Stackebrandtia nassauensis (strain DSM 44728 / CIP 108903 / NRRL B-16338 / NBRC 102104 / LLR-40K-21) TaxID=446470 RepID=D3Q5Z0_STANL|nr:hypothetical protein [Stackebrandtia nassauensis]ADD40289.1 hypothetical protein Snas_0575 [Stackebrandtia nassauensis DSM 44728]